VRYETRFAPSARCPVKRAKRRAALATREALARIARGGFFRAFGVTLWRRDAVRFGNRAHVGTAFQVSRIEQMIGNACGKVSFAFSFCHDSFS